MKETTNKLTTTTRRKLFKISKPISDDKHKDQILKTVRKKEEKTEVVKKSL